MSHARPLLPFFVALVMAAPGRSQCPEATLLATHPEDEDFGRGLARYGDRIVVGAPTLAPRGGFYVFERTAGAWAKSAVVYDQPKGSTLGSSVALDQDSIVAGDDWAANYRGMARVYELVGGAWTETAKLVPPTIQSGSRFGIDMSMDGPWLAISAPGSTPVEPGGSVFLYERVGGVWTLAQELQAPVPMTDDGYGGNVALQGSRLVVSQATGSGANGVECGLVHVYERGTAGWDLVQTLEGPEPGALAGSHLALDGDRIVAAPGWLHADPQIVVWERTGGTWVLLESLRGIPQITGLALHEQRMAVGSGVQNARTRVLERSAEGWHETMSFASDVGYPTYFMPALLLDAELLGHPSSVHDAVELISFADPLGTSYCVAEPNSTGLPGRIAAVGSAAVAENCLHLQADLLPPGQFGYLLLSQTQDFVAHPGGSAGNLCLGGHIGRFVDQVRNTGAFGSLWATVDAQDIPAPPGTIQPGDTWSFQFWFRDGGQSNFTDGREMVFQ